MLVIGHRGAAGDAPENTIEAMRLGYAGGADMLEFDVQLTRDGVPIVIHDSTLLRTHNTRKWIRFSDYDSIVEATAAGHKVALLEEVLNEFFGKITLNLELKSSGSAIAVMRMVQHHHITGRDDWDHILFSSFKLRELKTIRKLSDDARISLLQHRNPLRFIPYHKSLKLSATGFHHAYINDKLVQTAKQAGLMTYAYTVNKPSLVDHLRRMGVDGIVTDHPQKVAVHVRATDS